MQVNDLEIMTYLNELLGQPLINKKKADVSAMEKRLRKQMKNVGFGLRDSCHTQSEQAIVKEFEQICNELDKTHGKFKKALLDDKSIDPSLVQKHYGLDFTSKFKRMVAYQDE